MTASRRPALARPTRQMSRSTSRRHDDYVTVARQSCSMLEQLHGIRTPDTACPPRRSFVAGDARHRGQACREVPPTHTAFGDTLPTPAMLASVDKLWSFTPIADT